jgi:hypothetical protein
MVVIKHITIPFLHLVLHTPKDHLILVKNISSIFGNSSPWNLGKEPSVKYRGETISQSKKESIQG